MAKSMLAFWRAPSAQATKKSGFRADIQGLRALAVVAVIADHLFHWPTGGFVGVDIFFVISGFLITGLLLREHEKTGRISFLGFYRRRTQRIVPAAFVVLVVTSIAAFVVFNAARASSVVQDAAWAFLFSANWRFAIQGTDYFQATGPVSPLQHFWSLAVEEQFYFVWPWLMLLIFWLGGRSTKWDMTKAHKAIGIAMLAIVVLSFGWAMYQSTTNPTVAYFSTLTRTWELGVGALLAVFAVAFKSISGWLRPILGWAGLAGIVWSIFTVTADMPFPAPWAAAPVLATALAIAAGTGGEQRFMWPLTNRVSAYLGDISYSLYLWHFPVIIFLGSLIKDNSSLFIPLAVVIMTVLSVLSFHFVEERVRKSIWLDDSAAAKTIRRNRQYRGFSPQRSTQFVALGVLAVLAFGVSALAVTKDNASSDGQLVVAPIPVTSGTAAATKVPEDALLTKRAAAIGSALEAEAWPRLTPDVGSLATTGREAVNCQFGPDDAPPSDREVLENCVNGDAQAPKTAVLLGDSYAAALSAGVVGALVPEGWKVIVLTKNMCPAITIAVKTEQGTPYPRCSEFHSFTADTVAKLKPDMVVLTEWQGYVNGRLSSGAEGDAALAEWGTALSTSTTALSKATKKVVVISPPPHGANLQECATPLSHPIDCVTPVPDAYLRYVDAEERRATSSDKKTVRYIPLEGWFCKDGQCPPFIGANPVYVDGGHLTTTAAKTIAPLLREALS
jgi:peptidoglycan/LPS O-acetylase OafA/YrhL